MDRIVSPGIRSGEVLIPASKSQAHRMLIVAALSKKESIITCDGLSKDIEATIKCLNGLGAKIEFKDNKLIVNKSDFSCKEDELCHLFCGESGSTLRFMLPVVGALSKRAVFHMEGRLSTRPMDELVRVLEQHGMKIRTEGDLMYVEGSLYGGEVEIAGNISSQYISGLLFALPYLSEDASLTVTGRVESADYIKMTEDAIAMAGINLNKNGYHYDIKGGQKFDFPSFAAVERDWSNAAFFACMGALSDKGIRLLDITTDSMQGDKEIINVLRSFGAIVTEDKENREILIKRGELEGQEINASQIPDLVPVMCVFAAACESTTLIWGAERLRLKESDRILTTVEMLKNLGADIYATSDGMVINGKGYLEGGTIDSANDHRIAMAAAVAASLCRGEVSINGAECTSKSFPTFFDVFDKLEVN